MATSVSAGAQVGMGGQDSSVACTELQPGVIVERTAKNLEGAKAGLAPGDRILAWVQNDAQDSIVSPFDFATTESDFGSRGVVTLEGTRGTASQRWVVGPGNWGIVVRPDLPSDLFKIYDEAEKLADPQNEVAGGRWRMAAGAAEKCPSDWLRVWVLFHAAEALADTRQWKESDEFYKEAVSQARAGGSRIQAQLLQTWADRFFQRNDFAAAENYYQQAVLQAQVGGANSLDAAKALSGLGTVAESRGELEKAAGYFQQALAIREALNPGDLAVAASLNNLGYVAFNRGDLDKAEDYHWRALAIREKLAPGSLSVSASLNNLGIVAYERGELSKAEAFHRQALAIREKLAPGTHDVAASFNNLGNIASDRGDFSEAERCYRQTLTIDEQQAPGSLNVAASFNNLGLLAKDRGDLIKAEEYQQRALEIREKQAPGSLAVADSLNNLGLNANGRGDLSKAEMYHRQALAIRQRKAPGSLAVAASLNNLGLTANMRRDFREAEEYYRQALAIKEKHAPGSLEVAMALNNLGSVAHDRGDMAEAERYLNDALVILGKQAPAGYVVAESKSYLADVLRQRGELARAEIYYRESLDIWKKLAPESQAYADTLAALASMMQDQGKADIAAGLFQQAVDVFESQAARLGGSSEVRSGFRAEHRRYYRQYIDLLTSQNRPDVAFEMLERSRARTLLEMLSEAHVDIRQGVEASMLEQERLLQATLRAKISRRIELGESKRHEEQAAVNREIDELLTQYNDLEGRIRAGSPNYAALTQPRALSAKAVQQLLDKDSILLEYTLGSERSHVFAVTANSLDAYELPKMADIESAAQKVYGLLVRHNQYDLRSPGNQTQARVEKVEYWKAARKFSAMVLGPVRAQLGEKRLLIVSDGAMQYVPFSALPVPADSASADAATSQEGAPVPLIAHHEIVSLPSASVLAVLRQQQSRWAAGPTKAVAVVADPVFDSSDARVLRAMKGQGTAPGKTGTAAANVQERLARSAGDVGLRSADGVWLPRLAFSRREADAIMALAAPGEGLEAVDFQATREMATSETLAQYRVVHFATHGLLDSTHPELSGLVFSLVNARGEPQNGFLDLQDVYNLRLPVDLVVLSACETGLGKEVSGEGLVGLTRGFMYSGAPRVVASLWKVDDVATAELMAKFYRGMLKEGKAPAAALRQAQLAMWKQKRWTYPYYWAAFTLQGEWK